MSETSETNRQLGHPPILDRRRAGILLHPSSLPGPYGIGDFGPEADRFLDWMRAAGQTVWQILPLAPPALGGSPYYCLSSFAGNPALISPEMLLRDGLLATSDLESAPTFPEGTAAYGEIEPFKDSLLRRAFERLQQPELAELRGHCAEWTGAPEQASWLADWCLFRVLKARFRGAAWSAWPSEMRRRDAQALDAVRAESAEKIEFHGFVQWLFFSQWRRVREEAARRGVQILGDLPIYVAYDSADVWANPELFDLDEDLAPRHVAGVPPDYFSETGQLWGNPLYRWEVMAEDGYRWWTERLRVNLRLADLLRLDHFRAFADYWQVPAGAENAIGGRWVDGPGAPFFEAVRIACGDLPLVAEDLGDLSDAVHALRRRLGLPGMRILQFGFGPETGDHTPHNHEVESVVYAGTHDNDTVLGWYLSCDLETRDRFHAYTGSGPQNVHRTMIRVAHGSVAKLALVAAQDVLGLGPDSRMNTPGRPEGNWTWRLLPGQLDSEHAEDLRRSTALFGRLPES